MTQDDYNKAPELDKILYDCTGMLVENHPSIAEAMQKYADKQFKLTSVSKNEVEFCECEDPDIVKSKNDIYWCKDCGGYPIILA